MKRKHVQPPAPAKAPVGANSLDPLQWIAEADAGSDVLRAMNRQLRQRRRRRIGAVTSAVTVVVLMALFWPRARHPAADEIPPSASILRPAQQILADGTVVDLKDGAMIRERFTPAVRRVELTRGEAHFQVTKNPSRPFVVAVGTLEVRAVGTGFSVERREDSVGVLVSEGRVALDRVSEAAPVAGSSPRKGIDPAPQTIAMLEAGRCALVGLRDDVTATPQLQTLPLAEINERLAWRVPRLEFSGTPLGEALPMINAHNRIKLVLDDPALAAVRLSGVLRADNVDTLRELLGEKYGIKSAARGEAEIVLYRARP